MVSPASSSPSSSDAISAVHPDILRAHILNRLDGPSLASLSCASPDLRSLSTDDHLWRNISTATWPSVNDPNLASLIQSFNHGYRSFFSDSFPAIRSRVGSRDPTRPARLISAVDIYYGDAPIFSKVIETETATGWFLTAPFRIEALESKEVVPTGVRKLIGRENRWLEQLEENLKVSWIVIDPVNKRAANVSSSGAVAVRRHWLTGEAQVKFSTAAAEGEEETECGVVVTCGGEEEGGEVHVREVYLGMEDMEGRSLSGEESLGILEAAVGGGRRRRKETREEGKQRYGKFVERKREIKRSVERREKIVDTVFVVSGVGFFLAFLCFLFVRG